MNHNPTRGLKPDGRAPAPDDAQTTEDDLAGLYPANKEYGKNGGYPDTAEQVLVSRPDRDGYHDTTLIDADGNVVAENNRPRHRIEGALEGDEGYDLIVSGT